MALDRRHRVVGVEQVGEVEEAGLEHGVDPAPEAQVVGDGEGVDRPHVELAIDDPGLDLGWDPGPDLFGRIGAVDQDLRPGTGDVECPVASQEVEVMDCHEVGLVDQVCGPGRPRGHS